MVTLCRTDLVETAAFLLVAIGSTIANVHQGGAAKPAKRRRSRGSGAFYSSGSDRCGSVPIDVDSVLDQVLAQPRVAMKASAVQGKIVAKRGQRLIVCHQKPDCADIALVRAPSNQWVTTGTCSRRIAIGDVLKHQIGATIVSKDSNLTHNSQNRGNDGSHPPKRRCRPQRSSGLRPVSFPIFARAAGPTSSLS